MTIAHSLRVWRQLLVQYTAISLIYRAQSAIWMIGGLMPLAMMLVWMELADGGPLAGYSQADFALYFLGIYLVRQLTPMWAVLLLDRGIRHGELSPLLLRPLPPAWQHMAEHLGEMAVRGPVVVAVFALGLWLTGVDDRIEPASLLLFLPALAAGWIIFFNLNYCVGLLAFWIEGASALEPLLWYLFSILGGSVIPLDLFPPAVHAVLVWLPFASILDFPVQLLLGKLEAGGILGGFAQQLGWVVLSLAARRAIWRAGLKRFSAAGA